MKKKKLCGLHYNCWFSIYFLLANQSEVKFIASKLGSPDLPPWLRLEQREVTDRAFIYGTPGRDVSSQVVLEVGVIVEHYF